MNVKAGVELAFSTGPVPPQFFDAVTQSPEEAASLEYKTNASRFDAEQRSRGNASPARII